MTITNTEIILVILVSTTFIIAFIIAYISYRKRKNKENEEVEFIKETRNKTRTLINAVTKKESYFMELTGIALPRIDAHNKIDAPNQNDNLKQLIFSFKHKEDSNQKLLIISTDDNDHNLLYEIDDISQVASTLYPNSKIKVASTLYPNNKIKESFSVTEKIPKTFSLYDIPEIKKSPDKEKYHLIFFLNEDYQNKHFISEGKKYCIGRYNPLSDYQADIMLRDPDKKYIDISFDWLNKKMPENLGLGVIGFSRKHLDIHLSGDKLTVQINDGKTAFYILNPQFELKQEINPEDSLTGTLEKGDYLLLGNYLLRFGLRTKNAT
ncbi:hypothetical protein MHK_006441 [Candidatus Magnetomorum sp. HK-1]|nr:hypothetical protein MHK_006441 [Candidatus Magnetomorum sp. HK-1]